MHFTRQALRDSQAFAFLRSPDLDLVHFSYPTFFLPLGPRPKIMVATSSVGECAPSVVFQSGVPVELIKMLGDWHWDAVLLYLMVPLSIRLQSVHTIAKSILTTNISTPQPTQFGFGV